MRDCDAERTTRKRKHNRHRVSEQDEFGQLICDADAECKCSVSVRKYVPKRHVERDHHADSQYDGNTFVEPVCEREYFDDWRAECECGFEYDSNGEQSDLERELYRRQERERNPHLFGLRFGESEFSEERVKQLERYPEFECEQIAELQR